MNKFRELTADEIECRVGMIKKNGLTLLLYKDARCDMNILDETVGSENWQRDHYECKGNLFCRVGIMNENTGEWVWKSDCGVESYTEKEKGESSDSFKRACVNWGIGRALYTAPFIWIPADKCNIEEKNGKYVCNDRFTVSKMTIENGKIIELEIKLKDSVVFSTIRKSNPSEKVICPVCGLPVKPSRKDGDVVAPETIIEKLGMCIRCFRQNNTENVVVG